MTRKYYESAEQQALFHWAALYEKQYPQLGNLFAIPNGGKRNPREAARLKKEGVKPGIPDIELAIMKVDHFSHIAWGGLFIEMKTKSGKISSAQCEWIGKLSEAGYKTEICFSWQEAAKSICEYLEIEPKELGL